MVGRSIGTILLQVSQLVIGQMTVSQMVIVQLTLNHFHMEILMVSLTLRSSSLRLLNYGFLFCIFVDRWKAEGLR